MTYPEKYWAKMFLKKIEGGGAKIDNVSVLTSLLFISYIFF